jgi:5-methyltetrahydropteroyltriglutamate--homocysteine methyltransferase
MRKKLLELVPGLPLLPTTSVGSLPKPPELLEARAKAHRGEITREELDAAARQATEYWIRKQEEIGTDILVDGEMYRGDLVAYFASHLKGFREGGLVRSYGNRYCRKPVLNGVVRWTAPITVEWWKFAQSLTARPVKGIITGAYTMMDWSFNEHYPARKNAVLAIARELRKEVEALAGAGCKIIQVDEPALAARPGELPMAVEALKIMTEKLPAYFVAHACYGQLEPEYPDILDLPVHNLDLELANSELGLLDLFTKSPFTKDLSFGATDVHVRKLPTADLVRRRLKKALAVLAPERVWVDPDCGLKTRTVDEAVSHLKAIQEAAEGARDDL